MKDEEETGVYFNKMTIERKGKVLLIHFFADEKQTGRVEAEGIFVDNNNCKIAPPLSEEERLKLKKELEEERNKEMWRGYA